MGPEAGKKNRFALIPRRLRWRCGSLGMTGGRRREITEHQAERSAAEQRSLRRVHGGASAEHFYQRSRLLALFQQPAGDDEAISNKAGER